jgi:hypothetical protein
MFGNRVPVLAALAWIALSFHELHALAQEKSVCLDAHGEAQRLRKQGKLRRAREKLAECARATCPALVQKDCTPWMAEVEAEQPSVVLAVRDPAGRDVTEVRVLLDGEPWTSTLDGRPLDVDPGEHLLHLELAGGEATDAHVVVRTGEKSRVLHLDFPRAGAPVAPVKAPGSEPRPPASLSISAAPIIVGGVGVLALGAWAYFGLSGKARESELARTCAPSCAQHEIDNLHRTYLAADISLGAGIVALGVATWLALTGGPGNAPRPSALASWLEVHPVPSGATTNLGGRF